MKNQIKVGASFLVKILSPAIDIVQNFLGLAILTRKYSKKIKKSKKFPARDELWKYAINYLNAKNEVISFLEFGVHKGDSILSFSKLIKNKNSKLYGFDSFEGLPESWRNFTNVFPKYHFNVDGKIPVINDERVSFVKGWFNQTLPEFLENHKDELKLSDNLLIHMDADIYSSSLFVLSSISSIRNQFYCVFDQLPGEESRALFDFTSAFGLNYEFLGFAGVSHLYPMQVLVKIYK